jgi:hypothetical protein
MRSAMNKSRSGVVWICLLLVIAGSLFAYSVELRRPWFGTSPVCLETWLNASTILWAKHWYREGPWKLWFGFFWDPDSIEFPRLESRTMYSSYPPGGVLPVYALAKVLHREPSISLVMAYSLFNQLAVTITVSLLLYLYVRRTGAAPVDAFPPALVPMFVLLFLPSPASQFQMAYIHVVVLLPFVLCVFLELLRDTLPDPRLRRIASAVQGVVIFYGMFCDWLFAFVGLCLYGKRLATGEIVSCSPGNFRKSALGFLKNSAAFWLPFGLALGLFAARLYHFHRFTELAGRFEERSAMQSGKFLLLTIRNFFWRSHMVRGYGAVGTYLVFASAIGLGLLLLYAMYRRLRRRPPQPDLREGVGLIWLLLIPCLLHAFFLQQDSRHPFHFFTTAKFSVPLATIPFVLLPVTLLSSLGLNLGTFSVAGIRARLARRPCTGNPPRGSLLSVALVCLAAWYVHGEYPRVLNQFFPPPAEDPGVFGAWISGNTGYEDMLFTPNSILEVDAPPNTAPNPMRLAHTMKRIYVASTVQAIYAKVESVQGEYIVNYVIDRKDVPAAGKDVSRLLDSAYQCKGQGHILLYKIRKADFLALCHELRIVPDQGEAP